MYIQFKTFKTLRKKGFYYFKCNVKDVGSYFLVTYLHIGLSFFKLTLVVNVENNGLAVYLNVVQISIFQKTYLFSRQHKQQECDDSYLYFI